MIQFLRFSTAGLILIAIWLFAARLSSHEGPQPELDPAAWGSDHVGKPLPEYVTGDECLFCHRDVGENWDENAHHRTIIQATPDHPAIAKMQRAPKLAAFTKEIELLLGGPAQQRFLRRSTSYGKVEMLTVKWAPSRSQESGRFLSPEDAKWDTHTFGADCAGCHSTGVDSKKQTFSSVALDCYTCHGDVDLDHANDPALVHLSKSRMDSPRVVTSICAQCHIRTGKSQSTGRPYPNNFVAGDNLFRDFQVDFSDSELKKLNPGDRHILENVRDVVLHGKKDVTCLSCHDVHKQSSRKHYNLNDQALCLNCHEAGQAKHLHKRYRVRSKLCGY